MKVGKYTAEDYQKGREQGLFEKNLLSPHIHTQGTHLKVYCKTFSDLISWYIFGDLMCTKIKCKG